MPLMAQKVQISDDNHRVNWRVDSKYFVEEDPSRSIQPGVETYSGGWYGQGHEV